jgi:hypothetical protein
VGDLYCAPPAPALASVLLKPAASMSFLWLLLAVLIAWGCASVAPPRTTARPFDDVRRLAIVTSGDSAFAFVPHRSEPGRTFDEILAWYPYGPALRPLARLVHRGISSVLTVDSQSTLRRSVEDLMPQSIVLSAMVRALEASRAFEEVRTFDREPAVADRASSDTLVRVAVPAWGIVRVRSADPDLLATFADVTATMTVPGTGVSLWEHREDVTGADQAPLDSFVRDRSFARRELIAVLERAGQRLASELLYARSAGR